LLNPGSEGKPVPIRTVLTWPDERLKEIAVDVEVVDDSVRALCKDLFDTMYDEAGVGLAATQIGDDRRVVVVDCAQADGGQPIALINGHIAEREGELLWSEACLSLPGITAEVERSARIIVEYLDRAGEARSLEATGLLSVCIQHELDHLDGQLYIDRLGQLERKAAIADYEEVRSQPASELET
jgi:peptide deformylase